MGGRIVERALNFELRGVPVPRRYKSLRSMIAVFKHSALVLVTV